MFQHPHTQHRGERSVAFRFVMPVVVSAMTASLTIGAATALPASATETDTAPISRGTDITYHSEYQLTNTYAGVVTDAGTAAPDAPVVAGSVVRFLSSVTNVGDLFLYDVTVSESLSGQITECDFMEEHEVCVLETEYTVTEADALAGAVHSTASGSARDFDSRTAEVTVVVSPTPEPPGVPEVPAQPDTPEAGDTDATPGLPDRTAPTAHPTVPQRADGQPLLAKTGAPAQLGPLGLTAIAVVVLGSALVVVPRLRRGWRRRPAGEAQLTEPAEPAAAAERAGSGAKLDGHV